MPKNTLPPATLEKIRRDDHDTLVRLEVIVTGIAEDVKELKNGTTMKLADHEQRIKAMEAVHESVKPEETYKEFVLLKGEVRDFFVTAKTARTFIGILTGLIGALGMYLLTQLPSILKWLWPQKF